VSWSLMPMRYTHQALTCLQAEQGYPGTQSVIRCRS
jgi:hypothetical protein